jgi:hypothetical protein
VRPLSLEEQRRVLVPGGCLTCHPGESAVMQDGLRDFAAVQRRMTARCLRVVD